MTWKNFIITLAALAVGVVVGLLLRGCGHEDVEPIVITDTIVKTDTTYIKEHTRTRYITKHDTLLVVQRDTLTDTIAVEIPIAHKEYRDTFATDSSSIELAVQFSGYDAKIDSVGLQYRFEVQPKVIHDKKGWGQFVGVGVGVGYGVGFGQQIQAAPEIGLHIVYGFGYHW